MPPADMSCHPSTSLSFSLSLCLAGASWPSRNTCHCVGHVHHHQGGQKVALLRHAARRRRRLLLRHDHGGKGGHALAEDHIPDAGQIHDQCRQHHYARLHGGALSHGHTQRGRGRLQCGSRNRAHPDALYIAIGMEDQLEDLQLRWANILIESPLILYCRTNSRAIYSWHC